MNYYLVPFLVAVAAFCVGDCESKLSCPDGTRRNPNGGFYMAGAVGCIALGVSRLIKADIDASERSRRQAKIDKELEKL